MPEEELSGPPQGLLVTPEGEARAAFLVLSGSSGRVQVERCRALADHGIAAMSVRWFGGPGQTPTLAEVPVETFGPCLDRLAGLAPRLGVMGVSFGALAALLLGVADARLDVVAALAPSHVVWASPTLTDEGRPSRGRPSRGGQTPCTTCPRSTRPRGRAPRSRTPASSTKPRCEGMPR